MFQVRFHLGRGKNFLRWQVRGPGGVRYVDPETSMLKLEGCVLKNRRSVATRVNKTQKRDVCGHVACRSVEVLESVEVDRGSMVHFDPKVAPYWTVEGREGPQDGLEVEAMVSFGRRLYKALPIDHKPVGVSGK
jgi:hypothetical protein